MAQAKKTYTNADLNASFQLVWTHNLNTEDIIPVLYDESGIQVITSDNFWLGDETGADKPNKITLTHSGAITGTWKLLLSYEGTSVASGRKLFELTQATPTDDMVLAAGKTLTPSINITFTNLYALLLTKLGFLKTASNLSDLPNVETARTNLGTYSTTEIDAAVGAKATLLQAGSGSVIGVANTAVYTPSANYHPSTKKYVDDKILYMGSVTAAGVVTKMVGSITTITAAYTGGEMVLTHNYGSTAYVCLAIRMEAAGTTGAVKVYREANTAKVNFQTYLGANLNAPFDFIMFEGS
jgi:hypothetical protein